MNKFIISLFFVAIALNEAKAQVGINTVNPDASAVLDVVAKNADKGMLIPRIPLTSTTDITTIVSPAVSLVIYNTSSNASVSPGFYYWDSSKWARIVTNNSVKDLVTGASVSTASSPLVLTNNTGQVVGAHNATFTINNSAPLWNANQSQGKAISTTVPTDSQALVWDTTTSTWKPTNFGVFSVITVPGTTYTLSSADNGKILDFTNALSITITVPSSLPIGFQVSITQAGAGIITISAGSGMAVNNRWGAIKTSGQWAKAGLEVRATGSSVLSGDVQ